MWFLYRLIWLYENYKYCKTEPGACSEIVAKNGQETVSGYYNVVIFEMMCCVRPNGI